MLSGSFLAPESEDSVRFLKSLNELKELRSQIHYAADYCEIAFSNAKEKNQVLDTTKEYICRTVVTVVDHLGAVSTNLDTALKTSDRASEAEVKINSLSQKVLSWEHYYNTLLQMSKFRLRGGSPRLFPRYVSPSTPDHQGDSTKNFREADNNNVASGNTLSKKESEIKQKSPMFMDIGKIRLSNIQHREAPECHSQRWNEKQESLASVLPVRDDSFVPSDETKTVTFHFQIARKSGSRILHWRSMMRDYYHEIPSILRRSKSEPPSKWLEF